MKTTTKILVWFVIVNAVLIVVPLGCFVLVGEMLHRSEKRFIRNCERVEKGWTEQTVRNHLGPPNLIGDSPTPVDPHPNATIRALEPTKGKTYIYHHSYSPDTFYIDFDAEGKVTRISREHMS